MPASKKDLLDRLKTLGISTQTVEHPPLFTVEDAKNLRGEIPGGHTKNLFLKDKKGVVWLVVALEDADIDMKTLHRVIGSTRLSFGKPELMMEVLGVPPGSVTPFALINDKDCRANVILDMDMMDQTFLNYHPLINEATTTISSTDLLKFVNSCGHKAQIIKVSESEQRES